MSTRSRSVRIVAAAALLAPAAVADTGMWSDPLAPLPTPRQEVGVAELDGLLYVVGGINQSVQAVNTVERFNLATGLWEPVPDLPAPEPVHHVGCVATGGFLYVVGGLRQNFTGVSTVFRYDPGAGMWFPLADLPTARGAMGLAVVGGRIYAAGGVPSARSNDFAVYDPSLNQWTPLPPMPTGRDHLAAAVHDGLFYAISGRRSGVLQAALEVYDPLANMWQPLAPIPTPRAGIAAATANGRIYVFGGEGNRARPSGVFDDVEEYDPLANSWRALAPMPLPRHGIGAAVGADRIHIPGGSPVEGFSVTAHHDAFILPSLNRADWDCDRDVDVFDLLAYLDLWFALDAGAEFTGDEPAMIDVFDLLALLDCWFAPSAAPCP
jgi:N-acetylneuraminic acid mutarotase